MLPLIKVPYILIATVGLWITVTPPNPSPAENERVKQTISEVIIGQLYCAFVIKSFCWGLALAETAVLIAKYTSNHPYSSFVLSCFIFSGGAAERICAPVTFFIGAFMTTLGGFIRYKCYQALGRMYTFEMSIRKGHVLVTSGPYGVVRHPAYTGLILVFSGMLLIHGSEGSWVRESGVWKSTVMKIFTWLACGWGATITVGLLRRMSKEDKALQKLAGKEWEDWAKKVPYKLIPCIC